MPIVKDGPGSVLFSPVPLRGNISMDKLCQAGVSKLMRDHVQYAPGGRCVCRGIGFKVARPVLVKDKTVSVKVPPVKGQWFVFMHTSDVVADKADKDGLYPHTRGTGQLNEHAANYYLVYADGSEVKTEIRRRFQLTGFQRVWGQDCFKAVVHHKPFPQCGGPERYAKSWGSSQTRVFNGESSLWNNWLWAWENPHPKKAVVGMRFEPVSGIVLVFAVSAGKAVRNPLRWERRRKAILKLPRGTKFDPTLDDDGLLKHIQLDMGQVISARERVLYPNEDWAKSYVHQVPGVHKGQLLIEYSAHPDARFHLPGGKTVAVAKLEANDKSGPLEVVTRAEQRVRLKVVEKVMKRAVPVRLHIHGEAGEYLPPVDRHRIPNPLWFEDYSVDHVHYDYHWCTYIPGETMVNLPLGKVYVEVSKGFEIKPIRRVVKVSRATKEITIEIEKVLRWREKGWVSADTHVHFLSPNSALLEGAGEGLNVVNLLASQWGELMTNVGDFDGKTTHGSKEAGGDGEHLVRVGTENRQHVLGHISLLGYKGNIIAPMTTGGPDESAIGDAIGNLLNDWAKQCRKQGGISIFPHFPNPRAENAVSIINGDVDAIEMTSGSSTYKGIDPYSLSDWYRYLNCGYFVPAVGGTDKMSAVTAVGTVRTYARIDAEKEFTYENWKDAIKSGNTFVTYGPLMEFAVEGKEAGSRIKMTKTGGRVDVSWKLASVTMPMSRLDLIVNGEVHQSRTVKPTEDKGNFTVRIDKSSWVCLLVRGHFPGMAEIITAHSSPVIIEVEGSPFSSSADALTILEQIEGTLAYLDTVGTRAETAEYKRMRMVLTSAHRSLHNNMHRMGYFHKHTVVDDHPEHH